jgi:hypothetical protein
MEVLMLKKLWGARVYPFSFYLMAVVSLAAFWFFQGIQSATANLDGFGNCVTITVPSGAPCQDAAIIELGQVEVGTNASRPFQLVATPVPPWTQPPNMISFPPSPTTFNTTGAIFHVFNFFDNGHGTTLNGDFVISPAAVGLFGMVEPFTFTFLNPSTGTSSSITERLQVFGEAIAPLAVPGPVLGAGLPGVIIAGGGLSLWWRSRRRQSDSRHIALA